MNLLKENEKLKEVLVKYQDHMDEGIVMMEELSSKLTELTNAIKKHKKNKENTSGFISKFDTELWKIIEE